MYPAKSFVISKMELLIVNLLNHDPTLPPLYKVVSTHPLRSPAMGAGRSFVVHCDTTAEAKKSAALHNHSLGVPKGSLRDINEQGTK